MPRPGQHRRRCCRRRAELGPAPAAAHRVKPARPSAGVYSAPPARSDPDSYSKACAPRLIWAGPTTACAPRPGGAGFSLSYQGLHRSKTHRPDDRAARHLPASAPPSASRWLGGRPWPLGAHLASPAGSTTPACPAWLLRLGSGWDDLDLCTNPQPTRISSPKPALCCPAQEFDNDNPYTHIAPVQRTNRYVYLQDEYTLTTDWYLTAGLRHDRYSDFGNTTNLRAALVCGDSSLNLTTNLFWGRAYRAPAFIEAYGVNLANAGNPDIKPERISTRELAFNWQAHRDVQLSLNVFRYDADDRYGWWRPNGRTPAASAAGAPSWKPPGPSVTCCA